MLLAAATAAPAAAAAAATTTTTTTIIIGNKTIAWNLEQDSEFNKCLKLMK